MAVIVGEFLSLLRRHNPFKLLPFFFFFFLIWVSCQALGLCRVPLHGPILLYLLHLTDPFFFSALPPPPFHSHPHAPTPSPHSHSSLRPFQSLFTTRSPSAPPAPFSRQDSIIYSGLMLCMIWAIDEAISRSPPPALPSPSSLALLFNVSIWRKQTFNQTD